MCTLNGDEYGTDDIDEPPLRIIPETIPRAKVSCKTCQSQDEPCPQVSVNGKNEYCDTCFSAIVIHKFRATLGKSKLIRHGESVLVGHSGKANSTALLHLLKIAANNSVGKRLPILAKVLYIDDGAVKARTVQERKSMACTVAEQTKDLMLPGYTASLNCSLNEQLDADVSQMDDYIVNSKGDTDLWNVFDALEDDTCRDELLRRLRRKLALSVAKKLGCTKVFFADTSLDLAAKVLGDVSVGRGAQLSADVGFSDARCADVLLLKPMKDFTENEVARYLECHGLRPVFSSSDYGTKVFSASIRSIAYNFIQGLDSEFHGTVSTIRRTSEKLAVKARTCQATEADTCVVCEVTFEPVSPWDEELSAVQATTFSKRISSFADASVESLHPKEATDKDVEIQRSAACDATCKNIGCASNVCDQFQAESAHIALDTMRYFFCYGCRLIFLNLSHRPDALPSFILDRIRKRKCLMLMRKEITDFLL